MIIVAYNTLHINALRTVCQAFKTASTGHLYVGVLGGGEGKVSLALWSYINSPVHSSYIWPQQREGMLLQLFPLITLGSK